MTQLWHKVLDKLCSSEHQIVNFWLASDQRQWTRTTHQKGYSLNIVINTLVAALSYQITPVTVASNINKATQLSMEIQKVLPVKLCIREREFNEMKLCSCFSSWGSLTFVNITQHVSALSNRTFKFLQIIAKTYIRTLNFQLSKYVETLNNKINNYIH